MVPGSQVVTVGYINWYYLVTHLPRVLYFPEGTMGSWGGTGGDWATALCGGRTLPAAPAHHHFKDAMDQSSKLGQPLKT